MAKIRLFASDLDGTLLQRNGELSPCTKEMLEKLKESGCLIMINSGRPFYSIDRVVDPSLPDIVSGMNGQQIRFSASGEIIRKPEITLVQTAYLLQLLDRYPVFLACSEGTQFHHYCSKKQMLFRFTYIAARHAGSFLLRRHQFPRTIRTDTSALTNTGHEKICFASFHPVLEKIRRQLDPEEFSAFYVHPTWLEVQTAGVSKGNALRTVMERLHISREECAAAGDGENDASMLEAAGIAIVPKDGMRQAKEKASVITDTCDHDGIAAWIEEYLKNESGK
ncbi:MAG: Cof-type HAD-IIB family hydrolase [Solobacterium sp.]|nr:Cof-type HAD-IIB family hydrolase [Solobacterium sp.]